MPVSLSEYAATFAHGAVDRANNILKDQAQPPHIQLFACAVLIFAAKDFVHSNGNGKNGRKP